MESISPTVSEWQALHAAADGFYQLRPWRWFNDNCTFGVENPETHEVGYCSILGALGDVLALCVYLGDAGYDGLQHMIQSTPTMPDIDDLTSWQYCLMASFENREELNAEDLAVIKTLGFKFRGKQRWPLFRLFEPGFPPWAVDGAQARFLTAALEQAAVITQAFEDRPEKLLEQPGKVLVRVRQDMTRNERWVDQWRPAPQAPEGPPVPVPDTAFLNKLANQLTQGEGILESDFFYMPAAVHRVKGERPYVPRVNVWIESCSGFVLDVVMEDTEFYQQIQDALIRQVQQLRQRPRIILVTKPKLAEILQPVTDLLHIGIAVMPYLPTAAEVRQGLTEFMKNK